MRFISYFSLRLPLQLVYMAQQVEYEPDKLLAWLKRRPDLSAVMHRKRLVLTKKAAMLTGFQYLCIIVYLVIIGIICSQISLIFLFLILFIPIISITSLILAIYSGQIATAPLDALKIRKSRKVFAAHGALKIAILGSYGKTTMKELLLTVLGESKNVRATPGNKNVPVSHARWAATLSGQEEVLLIEFGESRPGDIAEFCRNTSPDEAVITGIASNHLDKYGSLASLAKDLSSAADYVDQKKVYINSRAEIVLKEKNMDLKKINLYDENGAGNVRVSDVKVSLAGMNFLLTTPEKTLRLKTALLGRHLLGPLALCVLLALRLGISDKDIEAGVKKTKPFEHRMQPREINGAWIIDDTYNGSLEGFRAGLALLKELKAKRKIYVTPGLVDQGEETENVHNEIGKLIAKCNPEKVILINNSVTDYIKTSLERSGYKGLVEIRDDALEFYTNLEHILAAGDIVLLQNDWTDNYY